MIILEVNTPVPCRLDRYLKKLYPELTQGLIERSLRLKKIMVNARKIEASFKVTGGDKIFIAPTLRFDSPKSDKSFSQSAIILAGKLLNDYLIYQDDYVIAINKPAGLATQGGSKISLSIRCSPILEQ